MNHALNLQNNLVYFCGYKLGDVQYSSAERNVEIHDVFLFLHLRYGTACQTTTKATCHDIKHHLPEFCCDKRVRDWDK